MASQKVRKILHLDLDAFFCAVEEQRDPSLRGKPFAVGGRPNERGVVASCSYAARRFGVRSALPMSQAVRLCPALIIVPSKHGEYGKASRKVMALLDNLTPLVEQISIDEAFLDVTLLRDDAEVLARRLQAAIRDELGLPSSLGVASNKLLAKVANNIGKSGATRDAPPYAIPVVPPGQEAAFLAPLPVRELWGVGPKTADQLARLGIKTIGDIARWPADDMEKRFGKHGADLAQRSRGIDDSPVEPESETKSVSKETTFTHDLRDADTLKRTLRQLSDGVGRQLRKDGLSGKTVKIKLRWADFTTLTRQITLNMPTQHDDEIYAAALELFEKTWIKNRPVRLIGVGMSGFEEGDHQLSLWDAPPAEEDRRLESTLDDLRDRFGDRIVRRGSDLLEE
ncbi:MAG: DNA polymerase IV [Anaerolineae bacterium]|nr:DNA polymerase IV [Anaerolineae bacterium]